ncbi:sensor histidine kinase [Kitasatospora aburaviensis]
MEQPPRTAAASGDVPAADPDAGRLAVLLDSAFLLLLATSLSRFLSHHPDNPRIPWVLGLSLALALAQPAGSWLAHRRPPAPGQHRRLWPLALVVGLWVVLVLLAPSFAWCAVPLVYTGLRTLPARAAIPLVAALTLLVVVGEIRLPGPVDANLVLLPPAVAALATAVFLYMERQSERQRALIADLRRTRRELAATERREGTLAERQRLAMEIHDTLAQGLSSQQMLLQAADRTWDADPATARTHVRTAADVAARNLAEARRFVHDLAPAELADGRTLDQALRSLAERESAESGLPVRFHLDGAPVPLPAAAQSALLRIAQGAGQRPGARGRLGGRADPLLPRRPGRAGHRRRRPGFRVAGAAGGAGAAAGDGAGAPGGGPHPAAPAPAPAPAPGRGHGLPAMRARLRQLGGTLTVESAPGEGTVVSAAIPLEPRREPLEPR